MKKILIVDDEDYIRELVSATLSATDYGIITARDGDEAIKMAKKEGPDLILLDVEMPKKDGYEVCRILKNDPETSHIDVLMLTAHGQKGDKKRGKEVGADAYFVKPFSPTALLDKVEVILNKKDEGEGYGQGTL